MKICMLTTCHVAEDSRIFYKEACTLSKEHDVTIISRGLRTRRYNKDGINIITIKGGLNPKDYIKRFFKLFIYGYNIDADVYHCHEPGSLLVGVVLSKLKHKKLVYDVHENWGSLTATSTFVFKPIKPIIEPYMILLENLLVPHADYVISVSESVQGRLLAHNNNHEIIYNYPIVNEIDNNGMTKKYNCVYTGNVYKKRGSHVLKQVAELDGTVTYHIIGDTDISMPRNVTLTDWIPHNQVESKMCESSIGLILFQPNVYNNFIGLPLKLFEYMQNGLAIIAPNYPEIREIVNKSECGLLVDTTNSDDIYKSIKTLVDNPNMCTIFGNNGKKAVEKTYNWKFQENRLLEIYRKLCI